MKTSISIIGWVALAFALCVWGAVGYAALSIQDQASMSASNAASSAQQVDKIAYAQRISALAADTQVERNQLDTLVGSGVVSIVNVIEAAGTSAHVNAQVSDAIPEGAAVGLPGGAQLQAVGFVVQAQGGFTALMQAVTLFEALPLPSSVEQVELQQATATDPHAALLWNMTVRIRVLTTAVSSS
jgi:hypothetical protein